MFAVGFAISVVGCGPAQDASTTVPSAAALPSGTARIEADRPSTPVDRVASPSPLAPATPIANADPVFRAMVDAIAADEPTYRFRFTPDRLDGDWRLEGVADDGTGPGRLFVDLTRRAGNLTVNPCGDPDFVQGGRCVTRLLPTGSRLVLRGLVEANGTRTVLVALIHSDRSGLTIEASNLSIDGRAVVVTRPMPLYSVDDLAHLVLAMDERVGAIETN
jgi:hypothetical protein